jgi:hypothetical protein
VSDCSLTVSDCSLTVSDFSLNCKCDFSLTVSDFSLTVTNKTRLQPTSIFILLERFAL